MNRPHLKRWVQSQSKGYVVINQLVIIVYQESHGVGWLSVPSSEWIMGTPASKLGTPSCDCWYLYV